MLTSDLVEVRRKGDDLAVVRLSPKRRALLVELLLSFHAIAKAHVGNSRADLARAIQGVDSPGKEARLRKAAWKLVEDACTFEESDGASARELRTELFARAATVRKSMNEDGVFDRGSVIDEAAKRLELQADVIEARLFSDLREAQRLLAVAPIDARALGESFELLETEALLLRAVNVTIDLEGGPLAFRQFHRELRFRGLLFRTERAGDAHRFVIDGPFALFESVTKYGLELALAFRAARRAGPFRMTALVKWKGAEGTKRSYIVRASGTAPLVRTKSAHHPMATALSERIREEVDESVRVASCDELFPVKGLGLLAPDLVLEWEKGKKVYVELLGFWSRDAVFERIERAKELPEPFLFLVQKRLRVSEENLDDEVPAALHVYATEPRAKKVVEQASELVRRFHR